MTEHALKQPMIRLRDQLRAAFQCEPFEHDGNAAVGVVSLGGIVTSPVVPCSEDDLQALRRAGVLNTTRDGRYTFAYVRRA